jgi:outer membrane lipoprotein SlyB
MNIWVRRAMVVLLGAIGGYAYYYFIGCASGACPITSNPYVSAAYGALIGGLAGWSSSPKMNKRTSQEQS